MAVVETPDRIMSTGGWGGGEGGSGIWMLLLVFLIMFRDGFGGRDRESDRGDVYKRHDAEFAALNRNEWDIQKEQLKGDYENRLQEQKCCCETNQNIKDVRCAVVEQGEKTRAHESDLAKDAQIAALQKELAEANAKKYADYTADSTYRRLREDMMFMIGGRNGYGYGHGGGYGTHCCNERPVMAYDEPIKYVPEGRRDCGRGDDFFRFEAI